MQAVSIRNLIVAAAQQSAFMRLDSEAEMLRIDSVDETTGVIYAHEEDHGTQMTINAVDIDANTVEFARLTMFDIKDVVKLAQSAVFMEPTQEEN